MIPTDIEYPDLLHHGFRGRERNRHTRSRLRYTKCPNDRFLWFDLALMLMSKYYEIHPFGNHTLLDTILGATTIFAILMNDKQIKRLQSSFIGRIKIRAGSSFLRPKESDILRFPHSIQSFISHVTQSIQRQFCFSLLDQYWRNLNRIYLVLSSKVVDQVGNIKKIHRR